MSGETGGRCGIAIYNDDVTPMEFVVDLLKEQFDLPHDTAS